VDLERAAATASRTAFSISRCDFFFFFFSFFFFLFFFFLGDAYFFQKLRGWR